METTVEYVVCGIGQVLSSASMPTGGPFTASTELVGLAGLAEYQSSAGVPGGRAETGATPSVSTYRIATAETSDTIAVIDDEPYVRQAKSAISAAEVSLASRDSELAGGHRVMLAR